MKAKTLQFGKALRAALFVLLLSVVGMTKMYASWDFYSFCSTGQRLYYRITDSENRYVCVTYRNHYGVPGYCDDDMMFGDLVIPQTVVYENMAYTIVGIDYYCFNECPITSVSIPNTVTNIGGRAFLNCLALGGNLLLPNALTEIGYSAFENCSSLTGSINIPNSVTSIGESAFKNCTGLNGTLTIGESVTGVGEGAFYYTGFSILNYNAINAGCLAYCGQYNPPTSENRWLGYCNSLTTLNLGDHVQNIPSWAFSFCRFTGDLTLPNSVTSIGANAFFHCEDFDGVLTIDEQVSSIGNYAFQYTDFGDVYFNAIDYSIGGWVWEDGPHGTLHIGENVTYISEGAFKNGNFTGSLVIPDSVTTIRYDAFSGCTGITELTIGEGVTYLGPSAFNGCASLETLYYNAISCNYANSSYYPFDNCPSLTTLIIGDEVETLPNNAFKSCSFAGEIVIPNSVTSIGSDAFYHCSNITEITIGESVVNMSGIPFKDCSSLETINYNVVNLSHGFGYGGDWTGCPSVSTLTIGPNVQYIPSYLFKNLSFSGNLVLPESLLSIGEGAFQNCTGFTGDLIIPDNVTTISGKAFDGCTGFTGDLTIGNAVETIGEYAFANCSGFTGALTIGESFNHFEGTWSKAFDNCSNLTVLNYNAINATLGGGYWLNNCTSLTTLNIGTNVQVIPENAFLGLNFSNDIVIPNAVTTIEYHAFSNCDSITSITIGEGVTYLVPWAIYDCNNLSIVNYNAIDCNESEGSSWLSECPSLTTLNIGEHVRTIFDGAFQDKDFSNNLVLPDSLESIGEEAFYRCNQFTGSLVIPNSVISIGKRAFYQCSGFSGDLVIGNGVTTIEEQSFYQCNGFTGTLTLGSSIETIGNEAFKDCSGFTGDLTIPNSVTTLEQYCFIGCSSFDGALTIGESVTTLGAIVFDNCSSLTSLNYNAINIINLPTWGDWIGNCNSLTTLTIGENVQTIFEGAFSGHSSFTGDLVIPNSVVSIGKNAFKNCSGFNGTLTLGSSIAIIGDEAFHDCQNLTGSLVLPDGLKDIGSEAFSNCWNFTGDLVIPCSVDTIRNGAFYDLDMNGVLTIGTGVKSIGYHAFRYGNFNTLNYNAINADLKDSWLDDCNSITTLNIGNEVQVIPDYAFRYHSNCVGELVIPSSVHSIGKYAFINCDGFTGNLVIPDSVAYIGDHAFQDCRGFTGTLTLPATMDSIGGAAFKDCRNFTGTLTLPNGITTIEDETFKECSSFTGDLVIPNSVIEIKPRAFVNCWGLDGNLIIGSSVETIGYEAFNNCSGFSGMLIIGNAVESIGSSAFSNCSNFQSIKVKNLTPPNIEDNTFNSWDKTKPVYIPCGSTNAYVATDYWNDFSNFQEQPITDILVYSANLSFGTATVIQLPTCTNSETVVMATPNDDYTFANWTEDGVVVSTDNPYTFNLTDDRILTANFYCSITAAASPVQGGSITTGIGNYVVGDTCILTAVPAEGFTFVHWKEGGAIVSTDTIYSFQVTSSRSLAAVFSAIGRTPGMLYGDFSVSDSTQVYFSQGNLQYIGSAATPYWKFADIQWDYTGTTQGGSDENIDRDLFGWGTSGYDHGAVCYQPWSTNSSNSNYYAYGLPEYNLNDETGQADWGYNAIVNGGNQENMGWRTLTVDEWDYLINTRTTTSGIRFVRGSVNNINGVILLPDHWSDSIYALNDINSGFYDSNIINAADWTSILEANGAVFLPASGKREGTSFVYVGSQGFYWSASYDDNDKAYIIEFHNNYFDTDWGMRNIGRSVRLVKDNVPNSYNVQVTLSPTEGGMVTGTGSYREGETCTLTITANEGYSFINWTENDEVVSNDATYSFVVTRDRNLVANFVYAHTQVLSNGWNWWSTCIELNGMDGLAQLENSIGDAGLIIKGRTEGFVEAYLYNDVLYWFGTLDSIANEQMYMIRTNAECNAIIAGDIATPSDHPISINSGWNWIGFPVNHDVSVDVAMSDFTPENNDVIKGRNGYTTYYSDGNYNMWYGTLNTLELGKGYMYYSNSDTQKTLVYQTGRGETTTENITPDDNIFHPASEVFASNMTITAVLELDGEELRSENYELAAFVGDECRGSVRLMYVEPVDRYVAFLTVFGELSETLYFRLTDGTQTELSMDEVAFVADGMRGTLAEPMTLRFGTTQVDENEVSKVMVYPNPSKDVFHVQGHGIRKIEVFNAFGQAVVSEETKNDDVQIDLSRYADGYYLLRVVTDNGITNHQLIKK